MQAVPDQPNDGAFFPVETAGPRIRSIFLMDTLKGENSIDIVLKNYLGLFRALRNQPVFYIVLVTFDVEAAGGLGLSATDFVLGVSRFEKELKAAVPKGSRMEMRTLSTVEMCRLLRQGAANKDCVNCDDLQFPSLFAQDPFVALRYHPGFLTMLSSVVSPVAFSYSFVAGAISNGLPSDLRLTHPTRFNLVGGNILAQREWAIVGRDTLADNLNNVFLELGESLPKGGYHPDDLAEALARQMGVKKIFWAGTDFEYPSYPYFQQGRFQPAFHVDYYLTPAGLQEDPHTGELQELIFVGRLDTFNPPTGAADKEMIRRIAHGLDAAAEWFGRQVTPEGLRFKVVRLPLLLVGTTPQHTIMNKMLSFNQVLVQCDDECPTVFMPNYTGEEAGIPGTAYQPWQDEAKEIYEREGFRVAMVNGRYRDYSFLNGGSLHCIAKVIRREE